MKIKPVHSGRADFMRTYRETMANTVRVEKADLSRLYNLRCSQLPYCPRSVLATYGLNGKHRPIDMAMAYYTSVGTTVHTVMQSYLSASGQFLADYECKECGKKYPLSHVNECCGFPTLYEEVTIDVGTKNKRNGIQGHIDGIFRDSKGYYWIIDFKTTTLGGSSSKEKNPGEGYKRQVRAYAVLLRKQYKITVKGVMLVFIPRDNPHKIAIWEQAMGPRDFALGVEELKADKKLHKKTMIAQTLDEVMQLAETSCGSAFCDYCKMKKPDFQRLIKKVLPKLPIMKETKCK